MRGFFTGRAFGSSVFRMKANNVRRFCSGTNLRFTEKLSFMRAQIANNLTLSPCGRTNVSSWATFNEEICDSDEITKQLMKETEFLGVLNDTWTVGTITGVSIPERPMTTGQLEETIELLKI